MSGRSRFDEVYERHYRNVLAYCHRRVGPMEAEAAANEVMAVAWRRLDDLPPGDGSLPWLYTVARNVLSHHWRSTRRRRRLAAQLRDQEVPRQPDPEQVIVMREELDHVLEAASHLSDRDQEILRLAAWEGLSHRQIAEVFGCSVAAVDQRLHRAKRRLAHQCEAATESSALWRAVGRNPGGGRL